ncbi:asparaginase [Acanthopleuribacter pedis]|uniref:Asparaginase n=2 Tax=Acanthopleuribacter pedis TaxID=442870 RepID=A0A8J7QFV2_9BACT|nr:asparaginase [Acanthopleuribacter pedis]
MRAPKDGALEPAHILQDLAQWIPELDQLADYSVEVVANVDSSQIKPDLWLTLARRIERSVEASDCDGIVVLHGTDTMGFTASALSYLLPGLSLPVVLTGGQRPLAEPRTDARNNVLGAIETALHGPKEVLVFFNNLVFRGNRSSKTAIGDFDGFSSPNFPELGRAGISWEWNKSLFWPETRRPSVFQPIPDVLPSAPWVIPWVPGLDFSGLQPALANQWAIILEAFGTGNLPVDEGLSEALSGYVADGGMVFIRSQVPRGSIKLGTYRPGRALLEMGARDGLDMTREAMVTKLMVLKGYGLGRQKIGHMVGRNLVGELTEPQP